MKNILNFKLFESINLRKDTEIITEDEAQKILYKIDDYFNGLDFPIFRGVNINNNPNDIFIIDPKEYERKSAYTSNLYTYLIDNSEKWKDYPKRSKSLICNTMEGENYGKIYRVIPLEKNSNWGISSVLDFWLSFPILREINLNTLENFNEFIIKYGFDFHYTSFLTKENFFKTLEEWGKKLIQEKIINTNDNVDQNILKIIQQNLINDINVRETLESWLNPDDNDFKHMEYQEFNKDKDFHSQQLEIWTDAKCLLIPIKYYEIDDFNYLY